MVNPATPPAPDFERLYAQDPDPWRVATSWYEQRKLGIVLAALRRPTYRLAWDAASGTGELAARVAPRCERVLATDASPRAIELTRARIAAAGADNVTIERNALPNLPVALAGCEPDAGGGAGPQRPDLIVLSEFLYYLDDDQRAATWRLVGDLAGPDTDIVAVHWRPEPDDGRLSGAAVQRELNDHLIEVGWCRVVTHTDEEFVMACWSCDAALASGGNSMRTP